MNTAPTFPAGARLAGVLLALAGLLPAQAASPPGYAATDARAASVPPLTPCRTVTNEAPTYVTLGKARVVGLPFAAARIVVSGQAGARAGAPVQAGAAGGASAVPAAAGAVRDGVADTDITLISPTELYFLGRRTGAMNVIVQGADGRCLVKDIVVTADAAALQAALADLLPAETGVRVRATEGGLVLTGTVSDALALDEVLHVAGSYGGEHRKVINLLRVTSPQQVMLEVTIAEVSKTILDHLNLDFSRLVTTADGRLSRIFSGVLGGGALTYGRFAPNAAGGLVNNAASATTQGANTVIGSTLSSVSRGATLLGVDAQQRDGVIRVLAEPTIVTVSGQSASFLSGGKIFIPVAQSRDVGGTTVTLEEKEFGVGLKFTPTVLDGSRINLKLVTEASELQQAGSPFTSLNGTTAVLPSMATRRVDTTVQLQDGQSFMVAGLIRNNATSALEKFPGLGEVPVMGALFRSTEFQNDQTELMFVVTPRLVKPLQGTVLLPTDNLAAPDRNGVLLNGRAEGTPARATPATD